MKVLDPGHKYQLNPLDGDNIQFLTFVKREGEKFPGNKGHYSGTTLQEVFRACIERVNYVNNQIPDERNDAIIIYLRDAILLLEERAAERHGRRLSNTMLGGKVPIELRPTCVFCGHLECGDH